MGGKSRSLRLRDVWAAYRLVAECRDLGDDVAAWRLRMVEGLCRLLGAQVGVAAEARSPSLGRPDSLIEPTDCGWESAEARSHFLRYCADGGPAAHDSFWRCVELASPRTTRR